MKEIYNLKTESWAKRIKGRYVEITFSIHWQSPSDSNINSVCTLIKENCKLREYFAQSEQEILLVNWNTNGDKYVYNFFDVCTKNKGSGIRCLTAGFYKLKELRGVRWERNMLLVFGWGVCQTYNVKMFKNEKVREEFLRNKLLRISYKRPTGQNE